MTTQDIRWIQRFNNFEKALSQLAKFIEKGNLNELERQVSFKPLNTPTNSPGTLSRIISKNKAS